jgi:hypothetical protein
MDDHAPVFRAMPRGTVKHIFLRGYHDWHAAFLAGFPPESNQVMENPG